MQDIDFLPPEYRQQHARRQVQPWRIGVVALFVALLAVAALTQVRQRREVEAQLQAVAEPYAEAVRLKDRVADVQKRLQAAEADAVLLTYLRHPWPRTQLLAALVVGLPPEISLEQIHFSTEMSADQPKVDPRKRPDAKKEEEKLAKAAPALRDLKRLRDEFDPAQTRVRVSGTTTKAGVLYQYLASLGRLGLFTKTELNQIQTAETPQGARVQFQLELTVRPGYGQPGGPTGKPEGKGHAVAVATPGSRTHD